MLFVILGDTFELISAHSAREAQLAFRAWRPAEEQDWFFAKRSSSSLVPDVSSTVDHWEAFPKVGAPSLASNLAPRGKTELVSSFPNVIAQ